MGKITIKHYLNKSIKPRFDGASNAYPLYVQIIVNRTNYKMKSNFSFWDGYIKEEDFNTEFIQLVIKKEKEKLELIVGYLIEHNKTQFLNADSFKKLSAPLWEYLNENFWTIFTKEGAYIYKSSLPSAFYNTTFYEIDDIINFTSSEIENKFSEKYKYLRIGMGALQNAYLGNKNQDLRINLISVFDFIIGDGAEKVLEAIYRYHGFYTGNINNDEIEYNKVIEAITDFIFDNF